MEHQEGLKPEDGWMAVGRILQLLKYDFETEPLLTFVKRL
jgi:hypothetical protein